MEIYRGDIFFVKRNDNNRQKNSEQYDERPAIVVSNNKCNEFSPVVEVVYLTTQEKKPLPTHVEKTELQLATVTGERDAYKAMLEKMMN